MPSRTCPPLAEIRDILLRGILAVAAIFGLVGCVSDDVHAFRGTIERPGFELIRGTLPMGGSFGAATQDGRLAMFGFPVGLIDFAVAVVYAPADASGRLTTESIREVYLVDRSWHDFSKPGRDFRAWLDGTPQARRDQPGVTPLEGKVLVERWHNNVDHRVTFDLASADHSAAIRGTVWTASRLDPNPFRGAAMVGYLAGAGHSAGQGRTITGSTGPHPPLALWQTYDADGEPAERGVGVLIAPQWILIPTALAQRWHRDEQRATVCSFEMVDFKCPPNWTDPVVAAVVPLPSNSQLCLARLDHAITVIAPAAVTKGDATTRVDVIMRDSLDRNVRGRVEVDERTKSLKLPRLDDEAKPVGGVALHTADQTVAGLLEASGRWLPLKRADLDTIRDCLKAPTPTSAPAAQKLE